MKTLSFIHVKNQAHSWRSPCILREFCLHTQNEVKEILTIKLQGKYPSFKKITALPPPRRATTPARLPTGDITHVRGLEPRRPEQATGLLMRRGRQGRAQNQCVHYSSPGIQQEEEEWKQNKHTQTKNMWVPAREISVSWPVLIFIWKLLRNVLTKGIIQTGNSWLPGYMIAAHLRNSGPHPAKIASCMIRPCNEVPLQCFPALLGLRTA